LPRATDGSYSLPPGTIVNSGDTIQPSQHNPAMQDIAQAMGNSLDRNGSGGMRAPLKMGGNPIQNIGSGSNPNDAATVSQIGLAIPIGTVLDYAGTVAPSTFLFAYGQAVSRADYPELFTAIGVAYGPGNGSTTFNLPDLRGRITAGKDDMGGAAAARLTSPVAGATLGAVGGEQAVQLQIADLPAHNHGVNDPGHSHGFRGKADNFQNIGSGAQGSGSVGYPNQARNTDVSPTGITTQNTGSGTAHNNVQPTIILNKIIKARSA